ncbi:MAG: hypothetical protein IIC84_07280, partial [Chloroflexi bacterium]|nr:hypothetical protein [Chloroflexota bacterium]
ITDQEILSLARREAMRLLESDPGLSKAENAALSEHYARYAAGLADDVS